MRIAVFFVKFLVSLIIIGLLFYFGFTRLWLRVAMGNFQDKIKTLPSMSNQADIYARMCRDAPASGESSAPLGFQLRFINDKEYVIEVVCSLVPDNPVQVKNGSLPLFVTKEPGSSGFYYDIQGGMHTKATFRFLNAMTTLGLNLDSVVNEKDSATPYPQPVTSCAGFGYQCCQMSSEVGQGAPIINGVLDCPGTCYPSCESVPFIQSFITDPLPNDGNEIIMKGPSLLVTFSYTSSSANGKISAVTLDFGDGTHETSADATGQFAHTYTCGNTCWYPATITAIDESGEQSIENQTTTYYIGIK